MDTAYTDQFRRLWEGAFEVYKKETGRELRTDDLLRRLETVDDLMESLDKSATAFTKFRSKNERLRGNLMKVLGPVIGITNFIKDLLPGTPGVVASPILAAVSYLMEVGGKVSQAYDYIESVFSELEEFSGRLEDYIAGGFDKRLEGKITAILTFFIKVIGKSEKLILKDRFRFYLGKAFLGTDDATKDMVDELNRLIKAEQQKVVSSTYASVKIIQKDMVTNQAVLQEDIAAAGENVRKDITGLKNDIASIYKESVSRADEQKLEETLKVPMLGRTIELYGGLKKSILPRSGAWLRNDSAYNSWIRGDMPFLFIVGEPGSGKTHLATSIISELQGKFGRMGDSSGTGLGSVAFFFIKESDAQLLNVNLMLKTLAYQIMESDPLFKRHAIDVCKSSWNTITAEDTWKKLFQEYYQQASGVASTWIVLDGLDEAPNADQEQIADILKMYITGGYPGIQIAVLGRPTIRDIVKFNIDSCVINITRDRNQDDIGRYIDSKLSQVVVLERLKGLNSASAEQERANLRAKISQQSEGVFLWAQLQLDHIKYMDLDGIKNALSNPPKNVTTMINSLVEQLAVEEAGDLESLRKLLAWVACSRRPLLFGELWLIMSLPSKLPRLLLWKSLNNKYNAIFRLNMPDGFTYEEEFEEFEEFVSSDLEDNGGYGEDGPELNRFGLENNNEDTLEDEEGSENEDEEDDEEEDDEEEDDEEEDDENDFADEGKIQGDNDNIDSNRSGYEKKDDNDVEDYDSSESESIVESSTDDSEDDAVPDDGDKSNKGSNSNSQIGSDGDNDDSAAADWQLFYILLNSDKRQLKTEIGFSHQQFRDILLQNPPNPASAIKLDLRESYVMMALSCLDLLRLREWSTCGDVQFLLDYPLRNLAHHLLKLDINALADGAENTVKLLKGLYWLFHEETGNYAYLQFLHNDNSLWADIWAVWVQSNASSTMVRDIFRMAENHKAAFSAPKLEWMSQAASSAKSLFGPWMTTCARLWLERQGHNDPKIFNRGVQYCYFLHALDSMDDDGNIALTDIKEFSYRWGDMGPLTSERIHYLANYAPESTKLTVHWYTNVACTLALAKCRTEAIPVFEKAMELDSYAWLAYEGLARVYADLKMYKEAIPVMEQACKAVSGVWDLETQFYAHISQWKRRLGDDVGALVAAKIAFDGSSYSSPTMFSYLDCLEANGKDDAVLELLRQLSGETYMGNQKTILLISESVEWDVFQLLERIFRRVGKEKLGFIIEDVIKSHKRVLDSANDWRKRSFCWKTAQLVYEHSETFDLDFVIQNYEMSLDLFGKFFDNTEEEVKEKRYITNFLARQYYDAAVAAFKSRKSPDIFVKKLKNLAAGRDSGSDSQEAFDFYGPGYPSVLWGRWRQIFEQAKKVKWRKCFRPRVLEELDMLDDENPENDTAGLYNLAITLLQAGDERNASALLTILFRPLMALRIRSTVQSEPDAIVVKPTNSVDTVRPVAISGLTLRVSDCHRCSGDCVDKLDYECLYMCAVCPGRNFCGQCIDKVKSGTLARRDCNPYHEWHKAWPSDEKRWRKIADENENGRLTIKSSWLEEMRIRWR